MINKASYTAKRTEEKVAHTTFSGPFLHLVSFHANAAATNDRERLDERERKTGRANASGPRADCLFTRLPFSGQAEGLELHSQCSTGSPITLADFPSTPDLHRSHSSTLHDDVTQPEATVASTWKARWDDDDDDGGG